MTDRTAQELHDAITSLVHISPDLDKHLIVSVLEGLIRPQVEETPATKTVELQLKIDACISVTMPYDFDPADITDGDFDYNIQLDSAGLYGAVEINDFEIVVDE
jgi:hypothetical protein